jgi:hypothetical protein
MVETFIASGSGKGQDSVQELPLASSAIMEADGK